MVEVSSRTRGRRRRSPALAFLAGAVVIGLIGLLLYLFWGSRAETPATPAEAVRTDNVDLPKPDDAAVRAQVDEALRTTPDAGGPAQQAASEAAAQAQGPAANLPETAPPTPAAAPAQPQT
jgi:cell division protein FtsN